MPPSYEGVKCSQGSFLGLGTETLPWEEERSHREQGGSLRPLLPSGPGGRPGTPADRGRAGPGGQQQSPRPKGPRRQGRPWEGRGVSEQKCPDPLFLTPSSQGLTRTPRTPVCTHTYM